MSDTRHPQSMRCPQCVDGVYGAVVADCDYCGGAGRFALVARTDDDHVGVYGLEFDYAGTARDTAASMNVARKDRTL